MKRISAYFRPESIGEAFALLDGPGAVLIGGGTKLNGRLSSEPMSVVDLQLAGLGGIERFDTGTLRIGATTTLQQLVDCEEVPAIVREAARRELPSTLRAQSTLGGTIVSADRESELLVALLVHDAEVFVARPEGTEKMGLEVLLAHLPLASHEIVTAVAIDTGGSASVARTARTSADKPWPEWRRLRSSRRRPTSSIRLATSAGLANTAARWPACSFLVRSRGCPDGVGYHTERRRS